MKNIINGPDLKTGCRQRALFKAKLSECFQKVNENKEKEYF
jgi:hypothetical protein